MLSVKMRADLYIAFFLLYLQDVLSIRIAELQVPAHAAAGGEALLGCQYDLEDDLLYSVKWYKDGSEFYRYTPSSTTEFITFKRSDVTVDMSRSSSDVVTLVNLKPESAGVYRCEVSGEKPHFKTVSEEKYINIHILPKSGPRITGLKYQYNIGDRVVANCSIPGSRPEAQLKWMVNREQVRGGFLRGPWRRVVDDPPDTTETTLGLNFMVGTKHFKNGVMEIKCQATIAPLYQREKSYILIQPELETDPEPELPDSPSIADEEIHEELLNKFRENEEHPDSPSKADKEVHEDMLNKFRELADTIHIELPGLASSRVNLSEDDPVEAMPENPLAGMTERPRTDDGNVMEKSIIVLVLTIIVQVILF